MTVRKTLLPNGMVQVETTTDMDRYSGEWLYDSAICEMVVSDIKSNHKIWTMKNSREGFESLDTGENWEPERESVKDDIKNFQKYLDETYGAGKYKAYALGALVHSSVSFAINTDDDTRCKWDSGTCGFIGIDSEMNLDLNALADNLSDAWNGSIELKYVYDNLTEETVDEITSLEPQSKIDEWEKQMAEKYGVKHFEDVNRY